MLKTRSPHRFLYGTSVPRIVDLDSIIAEPPNFLELAQIPERMLRVGVVEAELKTAVGFSENASKDVRGVVCHRAWRTPDAARLAPPTAGSCPR